MTESSPADGARDTSPQSAKGSFLQKLPLKQIWANRNTISVRLYLAFGGAVLFILLASAVALISVGTISRSLSKVNNESIPQLETSFEMSRLGTQIINSLPRIVSTTDFNEFETLIIDTHATQSAFLTQLETLAESDMHSDSAAEIRTFGLSINENTARIEELVRSRFDLMAQSTRFLNRVSTLSEEFDHLLITAVDDQLFYALTGFREIEGNAPTRVATLRQGEIDIYRHLIGIKTGSSETIMLLNALFNVDDLDDVYPLRESFFTSSDRIRRALSYVTGIAEYDQLFELASVLQSYGMDDGNGFDLRIETLKLTNDLTDLVIANNDLLNRTSESIQRSVQLIREDTNAATAASEGVIVISFVVLSIVNLATIVGALLIAWLYVGRNIVSRMTYLAAHMRDMAGGKLDEEVVMSGDDEIAEMAVALEGFRHNTLEVQRLNLVEELANQLSEQNEKLEKTNADLVKAQDQIVMQEKLAALGELTAGVAHEIKNPLNFIINFSDVSKELIDEMSEEIEKLDIPKEEPDNPDEDFDPLLMDDLFGDLTENLERISHHGHRANRIVIDMLAMGRGSTEWKPVDLNELIDSHVRLAFHSARGQDSDFQLKIEEEYDDKMGDVNAIPQDLGRVFLNICSNACQATDQRRHDESLQGESSYTPTLSVKSIRYDEGVDIVFQDNGPGMPPDVVEKIFQPFFTTKDPNKGTGLGMSLANDIVAQHGGQILIESRVGEGAQFTVRLPEDPSAALALIEHEDDGSESNASAS